MFEYSLAANTTERKTMIHINKIPLIIIVLTATSLTAGIAQTTGNSFVGKWKVNPKKSQMTVFTYKIEDTGNNTYRLTFGDGKPETIPADGTDQQTQYGSTWAIKKMDANTWQFTRKRDGKVTLESTWTVSEDGQTLTSKDKFMQPDGSTSDRELSMKRIGGSGSGLAATWARMREMTVAPPTMIQIAKWGNDGYSLRDSWFTEQFKEHLKFKTDGKDYDVAGLRVNKGETVSAKQNGYRVLELTHKLKGDTLDTDRWELSEDGKTLTNTVSYPGQSGQEINVFERE